MNLEQINARLTEIRTLLDSDRTDINIQELTTEANNLIAERNRIQGEERARQQLRSLVAGGAGEVVRSGMGAETNPSATEARGADSVEYRNAWLKNLARDNQGNMLLGSMSSEERAAFTFTTENSGAVVPVMVLERIAELVRATAPLLADSTLTNFSRGFGVPRHKSIDQGDAKVTAEGAANDDEKDSFDLLALDGEEIKKHIEMSRKMQIQSVEAFFTWVTTHLAERIRTAKERVIIDRLNDVDVGIAASNVIEDTDLTDDIILKAMGLILSGGAKCIYANNATIWNKIAKLKDEKGDKLFIPNSMSDPVVQGRVYGAAVKEDTEIPDDEIYIGVGKFILTNDFDELEIVPSVEPKTLKRIITGYSLFDAGLEHPQAFAKIKLTGETE